MSSLLRLPRSRSPSTVAAYYRFYSVARAIAREEPHANQKRGDTNGSLELRKEVLLRSGKDLYPRIHTSAESMRIPELLARSKKLPKGTTAHDGAVTLYGRVKSLRILARGLAFVDLSHDGSFVQIICNLRAIEGSGTSMDQFQDLFRGMQRGDIYSIKGLLHLTEKGQSSLVATELPQLCSPCLHQFPTALEDQETRVQNRHLDLQVNRRAAQTLILRSLVIRRMRDFLLNGGYLEVQTPVLANLAGGAIARAFETQAVEFPERHIELRTAPELWLKRLVLGGMEKIFEIGPCFRNEGLDKTHNPEFTTCEFYSTYIGLEELIHTSERLLTELIRSTIALQLKALPPCNIDPTTPFRRLDFIPEIESAMNLKFPDLESDGAEAEVVKMLEARNVPLPSSLRLPQLLDRLAARYLEPQCQSPTWIIHHPECLSPLSKSFVSPTTNQRIAASAELFIAGKEIVNTYEEENSPFEQRRKFEKQAQYRDDKKSDIDESYLEALEWGLPPTGGWGCGIERLVMLLAGTDRINDVLPFGNLRNVVSLGRSGRESVRNTPKLS